MRLADMADRLRFLGNRIREQLWIKPLATCLLSVAAVFVAKMADSTRLAAVVPQIAGDSVEALLSIMASSMLVIATFSVASMVSAYSSASNTASPRSFNLVIADDVSQRALSAFIGAFIFSIVGLVASKNGYFGAVGLFVLFLLTITVFGIVVVTFVRWVDRIARLGRLGNTIGKVEEATASALRRSRLAPALKGVPADERSASGTPVETRSVGYLQHIDMAALQGCAEKMKGRVRVVVLPGAFVGPGQILAYLHCEASDEKSSDCKHVANAFRIGDERVYDGDPRYGIVVLSQIAGRALSPAVNDPGTAIDIIGIMVRLLAMWAAPVDNDQQTKVEYDRVEVPVLSARELFDDAFLAIARDGSNAIEVAGRLQQGLSSLASVGDEAMRQAAEHHARRAMALAEKNMVLADDLEMVRELAGFVRSDGAEE